MNKGSGGREKSYYRISHSKYGSMDAYGNLTSDRSKTHINLSRKSYGQIKNILRR